MPRYYFHVHIVDGITEEDDVGATFGCPEDAINEAKTLAEELSLDCVTQGENMHYIVEVVDEKKIVIARIQSHHAIAVQVLSQPGPPR